MKNKNQTLDKTKALKSSSTRKLPRKYLKNNADLIEGAPDVIFAIIENAPNIAIKGSTHERLAVNEEMPIHLSGR